MLILSLFRNEGLPLQSDVATFHEGVNDAARMGFSRDGLVEPGKRVQWLRSSFLFLRDHLLTFNLIDNMIGFRRGSYTGQDVLEHVRTRAPHFIENLTQLDGEAERNGVALFIVSQQAQSETVTRERLKGLSYAREVGLVRSRCSAAKPAFNSPKVELPL
jgi:hypothetical protein